MKALALTGWAFPDDALHPLVAALRHTVATDPDEADYGLGWSLGALRALKRANGAKPLILLSATARFCGDGESWPGLPAANLRALQRQLKRAPVEALRGFHRLCAGGDAAEQIEARVQQSLALELESGLQALAELDVRPVLARCTAPVLLLHGTRDRVIPIEAARATAALLPNAALHEHPTAGHDLPLVEIDWLAKRITEFLDSPK